MPKDNRFQIIVSWIKEQRLEALSLSLSQIDSRFTKVKRLYYKSILADEKELYLKLLVFLSNLYSKKQDKKKIKDLWL